MAALRIYADESVSVAIVIGLRQRGVDAWCALDAGNLGLSVYEPRAQLNKMSPELRGTAELP